MLVPPEGYLITPALPCIYVNTNNHMPILRFSVNLYIVNSHIYQKLYFLITDTIELCFIVLEIIYI